MRRAFPVTLLLGAALLTGCKAPGQTAQNNDLDAPPPKSTAIQVATVTAKSGALTVQRNVSATIGAQRDSKVAARVSGTVESVPVKVGTQVPAGAVVVQLDPTQQRQALQNAQLQLRQARISLEQAQSTAGQSGASLSAAVQSAQAALAQAQQKAQSAEKLYQVGGTSLSDLQAARSQLAQAQSTLAQARQNENQNGKSAQNSIPLQQVQVDTAQTAVNQAQENLSRTSVRAPFAGKVAEINVEVGEFATQGSTVFRLVDPGSIRAKFSVPASDARTLTNGAKLNVAYGGKTYAGQVVDSTGIAGTDRLVPIQASVEGGDQLPIGATTQVHYQTTLAQGVLLPSEAVQADTQGNAVYSVEAGKAKRRAVDVLAESNGQVTVNGVESGSKIISPVPASLQDGSSVQEGGAATRPAGSAATGPAGKTP
ncbi:efflux RND transporter periplasmic adaptor subunit [Deinococcus sp.]|uniref:efflux RND transporter periplasmic adaptor subunit n=1 Tax=Deinococcus sp. TaxID=47478 RepID=UPI0025BEF115|nr:efflux RND transporter periplasmic adaptor subunit [Deinococcus sp.]